MQNQRIDIAVIGGGASGLLAAIAAKTEGGTCCNVTIFERNDRIGKKILATGNGRCNLGNHFITKERYGGSMVEKAFSVFSRAPEVTGYFHQLGLLCRRENGRLYPYSNHASAVLDVLRMQIEELGVLLQCNCQIQSIFYHDQKNCFILQSEIESFAADYVIFSCGGYAAPAFGTDGTAFSMLQSFDITVTPCMPALCALKTQGDRVRSLKGIRLQANTTLYCNEKKMKTERGEVQFTEHALSGICIFNLSAFCALEQGRQYEVSLDLLPDLTEEETTQLLWELYAIRQNHPVEDLLTGVLQKRVGQQILKQCGIAQKMNAPVSMCNAKEIDKIIKVLKNWRFPITGKGDWRAAQVTAGGVPAIEVTSDLEAYKRPHLYFSGEALDLHGDCGGYNLNWAWASGWFVGTRAAKEWKKSNDKNQ